MANSYCNLTGANKIKDEYTKINDGFDAVEADMNTTAKVNQANTFTQDQTIGGKARPLQIFQTSDDSNSTTNGPMFRNVSGENRWVAGYHPASGNYNIYDYTKAANRLSILPNGAFLIDGQEAWTDDTVPYEVGTFTPEIFGASTAGTNTYSAQEGRYIRIRNLVYISGNIQLSSKDTNMSGGARIRGFPFTPNNTPAASVTLGRVDSVAFPPSAKQIVPYFLGTVISLRYMVDNAGGSELQASDISNNSRVQFTAMYYTT